MAGHSIKSSSISLQQRAVIHKWLLTVITTPANMAQQATYVPGSDEEQESEQGCWSTGTGEFVVSTWLFVST
jgi:hypothetical protein